MVAEARSGGYAERDGTGERTMVERCIEYARAHGYSVLVEGTFRSSTTSLGTAEAFVEAGYEVRAVALAVPPALSRMSAVARFYETLDEGENRWTPLSAHEGAVAAMPETVGALGGSAVIALLWLMDRGGAVIFVSGEAGRERAERAVDILRHEHTRSLTAAEVTQLRRTFAASAHVARTHPVARAMADDASVQAAWELLDADQARLAAVDEGP